MRLLRLCHQTELEALVQDADLEAIDNDEELELDDVLDDDDNDIGTSTDGESDCVSMEDDSDSDFEPSLCPPGRAGLVWREKMLQKELKWENYYLERRESREKDRDIVG